MKEANVEGLTIIKSCRSCSSTELASVLSLGNHYVSGFVDSSQTTDESKAPLELVLCDKSSGGCGLLQLRHTVPHDSLYRNYWYRSGVNRTMREALADICRRAEEVVELSTGDLVLDVGCNDGTLLRSYKCKDLKLVGFDPALNLIEYSQAGTTKIIDDFFSYRIFEQSFGRMKAKVITSVAMFYDLEDPNSFVADVVRTLDEKGIWIIQMSYLPSMLEQNAFDNICHEHLEYYSLLSIEELLTKHGLEVFDVELNDVNGGSFRLFVRRLGKGLSPSPLGAQRVEELKKLECALGLQKLDIYNDFARRIHVIRERLYEFIRSETARGRRIYAYGASTKGNTLLQFCGLDNRLIKAAAERNPDKWGKRTVGTLIPIISEEQARAEEPHYFLILPWHFLREFKEREREFLRRGGKFIVPLPQFRIMDRSGVSEP